MSATPDWLYAIVYLAQGLLVGGVYVAGLVVTLRRWHLGMAPRLAAIGFGLLLVEIVLGQLFSVVRPFIFGGGTASEVAVQIAVFQSAMSLMSFAAFTLVVLAVRSALRDYERARNAAPADAPDRATY